MNLIQIIDCNSALGTCCNDIGLVSILDITRKILDFIQIIVPIILIVMITHQLIRLMSNPELKNGMKELTNKFLAAIICFFIPLIVNVVIGIMPDTYSLPACWNQAQISSEVLRSQKNTYISTTDKKASQILIDSGAYEQGVKREEINNSSSNSSSNSSLTGAGNGSTTGKAIVNYALQFVGKPYVWGGHWNGELPYTGTDCSGFTQGVFKHFGISLNRTTSSIWADKSKYTLVTNGEIRAGDLVMYDGHVGILTGNGKQIVHAKGSKWGVVTDPDYSKCSSHAILGIMRINGVN